VKSGKVWGTTELIAANPAFEYHRIEIKAGGYCSKHKHQSKYNGFYVESGQLLIRVWREQADDVTVLQEGQYTQVEPGLCHQFEALTDCVAYELYWSQYEANDIQRENLGGMRTPFIERPT
jgi:quercetin dioxygenase-like cupin family protein